ncbi:MAG: redoxin domain-containing protein [Halapricum sp.]
MYDFSPVCTAQLCEVNDMELLTINDDVGILGVSTDGPFSHQRFIAENDLSYPLLTDDDKILYERFGMIEETDEGKQQAKRGLVLVDESLTVRYWWQAEGNWDKWTMEPLEEAHNIANELIS